MRWKRSRKRCERMGWLVFVNDCVPKIGKKEILEMEVAGTRRRKIADSKAVKHTNRL